MDFFFLALAIIFSGGVLPLFFWRHFVLMKTAGAGTIAAGCLVGLASAVAMLWDTAPRHIVFTGFNAFHLNFAIDGLAAFFLVAVFGIGLLSAIYSGHYLDKPQQGLRSAAGLAFFSLLIVSMAMTVAAADMICFLLAWETMSLASFFLVIYDHEKPANQKAGLLYLVFSHAGALFILAAFGLIFSQSSAFGFDAAGGIGANAKTAAFILAFVGFGSKAGVFPLHVWLPHAHPAAPSHISALMSGVMIKIGIYGIIRTYVMLESPLPTAGILVLTAGLISGILGVVYALGQHDIKRLLAYHSVENIGIILIGLGIGMIGLAQDRPLMAAIGFGGGLLHVLNHAIFKSLLFMGAGMVIRKTGIHAIDELGGLLKPMRITGTCFLLGSLAITGLPPLNGFVSELLIYLAAFQGVAMVNGPVAPCLGAIVGLAVIGGLALACFTKVVGVVFQGEPRRCLDREVDEKGAAMILPMLVLAAACVLIGVVPGVFVAMALRAVTTIAPEAASLAGAPLAALSARITGAALLFIVVVLAVGLLRCGLYRKKTVTRGPTWGCGFTRPTSRMQYTGTSFAAAILDFFRPMAPVAEDHPPVRGLFPDPTHYRSHVHDIAERHLNGVIVAPVLAIFDKLRWIQHGDIHLYIGYILLAIAVLLVFI